MKKLLILMIIGICAIALRMPEVADAVGLATATPPAATATASAPGSQPKPMTAAEFAELSKSDPQAYQKYLASHIEGPVERSEVDKLMNLLARGKYE